MDFLLFQAPYLGNGMVIGVNAIVHVIISHGVAIGLMAMIFMAEYIGIRKNSETWENFAKELLKPAVIIITGVGAVTGVGIWFTTSALAPRGIGSMLRVFFWPWFVEWIVFTLEVIAILIYYFQWEKWTANRKKYRWYLGLGYFLLASVSAFLITGILGFMLTSDGWPWNKSFWSAFFNPSFVPQLFVRFSGSFVLGALFAIFFLLFKKRDKQFQKEVLHFYSKILLISIISTALFSWWYFVVVPSRFKTHAIFSILTSHLSQQPEIFWISNVIGITFLILFSLLALKRSIPFSRVLIVPAILIMFGFVSEFERIREFIRGPYLMPGYMYSNQILIKESDFLKKDGLLKNSYWFNMTIGEPTDVGEGAFLFAQNCSMCHTIAGINDIKERVLGRTRDGIAVILNHTNDMVPFMPPFSGAERERQVMAHFLYQLSQGNFHLLSPSRYTPFSVEAKNE
jgi:mono/diheme cytochrome c family protein